MNCVFPWSFLILVIHATLTFGCEYWSWACAQLSHVILGAVWWLHRVPIKLQLTSKFRLLYIALHCIALHCNALYFSKIRVHFSERIVRLTRTVSHRLKVTWTTVFSHCDFKQNTCCALSRMSPPEPPEQPVSLKVADAMIDASKSLRTKKKVWTKISLLLKWTYFRNRLLLMLIEPVFDTSSMAPPPAAPFRWFLQEPGVKKQKTKQKQKRT